MGDKQMVSIPHGATNDFRGQEQVRPIMKVLRPTLPMVGRHSEQTPPGSRELKALARTVRPWTSLQRL